MTAAVFIHWIIVRRQVIALVREVRGVGKIPADHIVDIAVTVIIETIAIARIEHPVAVQVFSGINPQLPLQILVQVIDPGIDHPHHHIRIAGLDRPGGRGLDGGKIPLLGIERIIGIGERPVDPVRLGIDYGGLAG